LWNSVTAWQTRSARRWSGQDLAVKDVLLHYAGVSPVAAQAVVWAAVVAMFLFGLACRAPQFALAPPAGRQ